MIVNGLVNGLLAGMGQIKSTISSLGDSTIGWFKEKLGIHSPSRVFAELGGFTTEGLAVGVNVGAKAPLDAVARLGQDLTKAGQFDLQANTSRPTAEVISLGKQLANLSQGNLYAVAPQLSTGQSLAANTAPGITLDSRPPIAGPAPSTSDSHDVININIHPTPGMDPQAIARAVSAELDRRNREKSARQRSRLSDQE